VRNGVNVANTPDGIRIERDALMDAVEDYNRMYKEATERALAAEAETESLRATIADRDSRIAELETENAKRKSRIKEYEKQIYDAGHELGQSVDLDDYGTRAYNILEGYTS
jgi:peptidoglycan hydrolase CwlO-like protein